MTPKGTPHVRTHARARGILCWPMSWLSCPEVGQAKMRRPAHYPKTRQPTWWVRTTCPTVGTKVRSEVTEYSSERACTLTTAQRAITPRTDPQTSYLEVGRAPPLGPSIETNDPNRQRRSFATFYPPENLTMHNTRKKVPSVEPRVQEILEIMSAGLWVPGKGALALAKKWGIPTSTVRNYSAEAWRRLCAASDEADKLRPELAGMLYVAAQRAFDANRFDSLAKCADTLSKITGARAAERHEHAVAIAQFDALDRNGKIEYFRESLKEIEAAIALLEAEGQVVQ